MTSVRVEPFNIHRHYAVVAQWWEERGQPVVPVELLPKIGFFAENTCAGFLYQTDSGIALIEALISSPQSEPAERDSALDRGVSWLVEQAEGLGYTSINAFSTNDRVIDRARRHGFKVSDQRYALVTRRV